MNNSIFARIRWPRPLAGLEGITLADIPREVSAGITLAALMIPLNIGYAQVAGLPPVAGLYAAIIPLVVFALLASSRHLVTSPDASMATLVGAALVAFAAPGNRGAGGSARRQSFCPREGRAALRFFGPGGVPLRRSALLRQCDPFPR
jgi:MFS superfamily sulfate permease-like transporter